MVLEILSYGFMQKALITGIFIALACSLLGVFLVLRRYALIGDGLAHISFGGVALGLLFKVMPFISALVFSIISSLGILKLREKARLHGDASIGIISHASLGLGIFIASIANSFNVDILSYLFGSILSISFNDMIISSVLAIAVIATILLFYEDLFVMTFDEESARTSGVKVNFLSTLIILLTAITIVSSMRLVGLLLASALIVLPSAASLQVARSFKQALFFSASIAVVSVIVGMFLSYYFDWATSGTIVLLNFMVFIVLLIVRKIRN